MKLSVIVLTQNEEKWLPGCLNSVHELADEIIVVDNQSTDKTVAIAKKYGAKVFVHPQAGFAAQREFGLRQAQADWVLYLDADERVTKELAQEIENCKARKAGFLRNVKIENLDVAAYYLWRQNIFLGKEQRPDKVEKLFKRKALMSWQGVIHESPQVKGRKGTLKNHLVHLTHRDIESMTKKTLKWSKIEAELLMQSGHPPVTWWRLLRALARELRCQALFKQSWRYGLEGWLESIFQVFSRFITYSRLWERQRPESLEKTYEKIDRSFQQKQA